jgi:hypothetical protein
MEIGHYSMALEYLEKIINEFLQKYPKHIMLKENAQRTRRK